MPQFVVFSRDDENSKIWQLRGTTMADNSIEACEQQANADATNFDMDGNRVYSAVRTAYWDEHEFKFEVTPHRVPKNEILDRREEAAKV